MIIRKATLDDLDFIMTDVADDMFALQGDSSLRDDEYMRNTLIPYIISNGVCLIAEIDGKCIGSIAGVVVPTVYNPNKTNLAELWWWVNKENRKGSVGAKLLFMFEVEAQDRQVNHLTMSILPNTHLNTQALEKRGYMLKESAYGMNL